MERKEARHANNDRPERFVPDVEVVMRKAAALLRQNAVVGVFCGELRQADAEGLTLFHAPEDEVDAKGLVLLHAPQRGQHVFFFAHSFFRPFDG